MHLSRRVFLLRSNAVERVPSDLCIRIGVTFMSV